ncbi:hypothetical protein GCM10009718_05220 [Isoptericola halotolerans]|uniref:DUF3093 family protein n=1 Tax=Isoptericola halotolerans TaxID=300560 RepID=A0ABX2A4N5_9MICO|nr:hypothetical protein [Isoptericola halotolerans]NOV96556.1 hypothetical protein [Isoptericola halotolerans]
MSVVWQQVGSAQEVESPLADVPDPERPGWLRRWLWLPALLVAIGVYVARRLVADPSGEVEMWLMLALVAAVTVTAVAALVRYRDDQRLVQERRAAEALRADARSTTGSVTVSQRVLKDGTMLHGMLTYPRDGATVDDAWSLMVADGDAPGPRPHDPVAVWWAPGSDTAIVRYHRGWADDVRRSAS